MKNPSQKRSKAEFSVGDSALQVPALQRGLAMLEFLASLPEGATLSELGTELDISIASVFRLAGGLEELGYIRRDEKTKRFAVTQKLLLLGQPHSGRRSLVESALEPMRRILAATGETTQLCCLAEADCVMLEQLPALHPFKYVVDLGSRVPIHCCAPGKAMLAFLPDDVLDSILPRLKFEKHTERTILSREALLVEFERVRARGYALDCGEHFDGIHCVAAPLLDRHGHTIAAITIAGPAARVPASQFEEIGQIIIAAANEAARRFQE
ncbi:MAG: IclR family transcriptional regulator [Chthoniobacter sp.]|nr:IclR family transcriptional regulator [Chthoniobacter sp.]